MLWVINLLLISNNQHEIVVKYVYKGKKSLLGWDILNLIAYAFVI